MIDDCNINNLAKNQVSAFFIRALFALYGDAMFVPFGGNKHGGRDVTKTSVVEFCYCNENFYSRALAH